MLAECANSPVGTTPPSPSHCAGSLETASIPCQDSRSRSWAMDCALTGGFCGGSARIRVTCESFASYARRSAGSGRCCPGRAALLDGRAPRGREGMDRDTGWLGSSAVSAEPFPGTGEARWTTVPPPPTTSAAEAPVPDRWIPPHQAALLTRRIDRIRRSRTRKAGTCGEQRLLVNALTTVRRCCARQCT